MQYPWTMADVSAAWKACNRYYAESPIICRALCGHTIEEEHDLNCFTILLASG